MRPGWTLLFGAGAGAVAAALFQVGRLGGLVLGALVGAVVALKGARWRHLSLIDPGTGLYNRRYLFTQLDHTFAKAIASGRPLCFLVVEVDDMRKHNNRHGHQAGDAVLAAVAVAMRQRVRRGDTVGRWGGDEFGIILPGATLEEALGVAERIRRQVAALSVEIEQGEPLHVTVSLGAASACVGDTVRTLVDRADFAMYEAKKEKNRVIPAVLGRPQRSASVRGSLRGTQG